VSRRDSLIVLASLLVLLAQQSLVLLLRLDECFLEEVGIYIVVSKPILLRGFSNEDLLSELAKRIASV
jgi:hypothetical protein